MDSKSEIQKEWGGMISIIIKNIYTRILSRIKIIMCYVLESGDKIKVGTKFASWYRELVEK